MLRIRDYTTMGLMLCGAAFAGPTDTERLNTLELWNDALDDKVSLDFDNVATTPIGDSQLHSDITRDAEVFGIVSSAASSAAITFNQLAVTSGITADLDPSADSTHSGGSTSIRWLEWWVDTLNATAIAGTNADITGTLGVDGDVTLGDASADLVTIKGDLAVDGDVTLTGTLSGNVATDLVTITGDLAIGDASSVVTITGKIDADILPYTSATPGLGNSSNYWTDAYITTLYTSTDYALKGDTDIKFQVDADNDGTETFTIHDGAGTEVVSITEAGALQIDGAATLDGNVTLGNATADVTTISGELDGSRHSWMISESATVTASAYGTTYISTGGITQSSTVGFRAATAGSIVGISVNCNVTAANASGVLVVAVDGTWVFGPTLPTGTGVGNVGLRQNRGVDNFTAGQIISIRLYNGTFTTYTFEDYTIELEYYYDD